MYSQNSEEHYILENCPRLGRFLDIGAYNPTVFSNTRALYERGWGGVMVEPSPGPFAALRAAYGDIERIQLINAAVTLRGGTAPMHITDDGVSTLTESVYDLWKGTANYKETISVPCITLEEIFAAHGAFDFVSIDAEGCSVDLALRLLELGARPRCICVEHDGRERKIRRAAFGYRVVYENPENLVLVRACGA